jgi:hypothetical protein
MPRSESARFTVAPSDPDGDAAGELGAAELGAAELGAADAPGPQAASAVATTMVSARSGLERMV